MAKAKKAATLNTTLNEFADNMEKELGQPGTSEQKKSNSPNGELDLSGFDYRNLTGESFTEYISMVGDRSYKKVDDEGREIPVNGELLQNDKYDFVLLPAVPVMKARFPGMENTPWDFVGIKAKDTVPIHRTRIPVKTALEYNAQIINQHSRAGHGKYYFLAKD